MVPLTADPVYKFPLVYLIFACNKTATALCHTLDTPLYQMVAFVLFCLRSQFAVTRDSSTTRQFDDDDEWYWEVSPFLEYTDFERTHRVYRGKQILSVCNYFLLFRLLSLPSCRSLRFYLPLRLHQTNRSKVWRKLNDDCARVCVCVHVCVCVSAVQSVRIRFTYLRFSFQNVQASSFCPISIQALRV